MVEADGNVFCRHFVIIKVLDKSKFGTDDGAKTQEACQDFPIHPEGNVTVLNFMTISQTKPGDDHHSHKASSLKKYKCHFMAIHPIVEIFQSGQK